MKFMKAALLAVLLALCMPAWPAFERMDEVSNTDVDSLETVGTFTKIAGHARCVFQVTVGVATLTDFDIAIISHPSGTFSTAYSVSADYTSPQGILIGTSGDLTVQAAGVGWLILDVSGLSAVRFSAAGTNSTVEIMGACL